MYLFQTTNVALSITLATCGVPFARDEERACEVPFVHLYDVAVLRKFRDEAGNPRYKGWPLEKAARDAFQRGLKGVIVYNFVRNPLCDRICKAYDRASQAITAADAGGAAAPLALDIEPEDAAALCAQFTRNRNTFVHGWKAVRPYLHLPGESRQGAEGGKTVIIGSFKLVPL